MFPTLADTAHRGMTILGWNPDYAPNPSCCSSPRAMCPKCAALVFSGLSTNSQPVIDRSEYLEIPTINWTEPMESPTSAPQPEYDRDLLIPPTIDWTEVSRQQG